MYEITSKNKTLILGDCTVIMGIINCTPDSFSGDGIYRNTGGAVKKALQMIEDGAKMIDVGGESTRPGSEFVSNEEELGRILPVIEGIRSQSDVWISVDTWKSDVAEEAIKAGADIINDISGLRFDDRMIDVAVKYDTPVIVMHIKGEPKNMQKEPHYDDVIDEILNYFRERIRVLTDAGLKFGKIILDPGVGFGKLLEHNLQILNNLDKFGVLERPVVIGTSRKSFIEHLLGLKVEDRLVATAASLAVSVMKGAHIARVHDVKEMNRVVKLVDAVVHAG